MNVASELLDLRRYLYHGCAKEQRL